MYNYSERLFRNGRRKGAGAVFFFFFFWPAWGMDSMTLRSIVPCYSLSQPGAHSGLCWIPEDRKLQEI